MATIEERLTALEQEFAGLRLENKALRNLSEIQSMALQSRVTQSELAKARDTNNSVFDALIGQNKFTNERLGDIQTQIVELDGKIVGMQTEMRQGFEAQDKRFDSLEQGVNSRFESLEQGVNSRFESLEQSVNSRFEAQDKKLDQVLLMLTALTPKPEQEK